MSATSTTIRPDLTPAGTDPAADRPTPPDRKVARLWVKTVKQAAAAAVLTDRYGTDAHVTRLDAVASQARRDRAVYLDPATSGPAREMLRSQLAYHADRLRTLIVDLHRTAGHACSLPAAERTTDGR